MEPIFWILLFILLYSLIFVNNMSNMSLGLSRGLPNEWRTVAGKGRGQDSPKPSYKYNFNRFKKGQKLSSGLISKAIKLPKLAQCGHKGCPNQAKKLYQEYVRLNMIESFLNRLTINISSVSYYEMRNIIERLIITMGNYSDGKEDPIFYRAIEGCQISQNRRAIVDERDYPIIKAIEEIFEKDRTKAISPNAVYGYFEGFLRDMSQFLDNKRHGNMADLANKLGLVSPSSILITCAGGDMILAAEDGIVLFSYKTMQRRLRLLRERATFNMAHDKHVDAYIMTMLLRYECMVPSGQQWGFSEAMYRNLRNNYGINIECFGSPKNSQMVLIGQKTKIGSANRGNLGKEMTKYGAIEHRPDGSTVSYDCYFCSLYPDVDHYFGSIGSFFDLDLLDFAKVFKCHNIGGMVGPPYIMDIMDKCVTKMHKEIDRLKANSPGKLRYRFVYNMPAWEDTLGYQGALNSPYKVYDKYLGANEHYYIDSNRIYYDKKNKREYPATIVAKFPSHIFVLEYPEWPGADFSGLVANYGFD